jgi:hypothetical protein
MKSDGRPENIIKAFLDMNPNLNRKEGKARAYARDSDLYLRFCTNCNKVWEKGSRTDSDNKNIIYYDDFPSLGKKREHCKQCK